MKSTRIRILTIGAAVMLAMAAAIAQACTVMEAPAAPAATSTTCSGSLI